MSTKKIINIRLSTSICPRPKTYFTCTSPHVSVYLQETFKNMRKLSIVLLLISISFMTMKANNLSEHKSKYLVLKRWDYPQRALVPIPIEATQDENSIEVRFLEDIDDQVTFQVKDQLGNIIFQDVIASFLLSLRRLFLTESTVIFNNFASVLVSNPYM